MDADKHADSIAEVRDSVLPNAGKGAFAARDISAGEVLGTYQGRLLSRDEYKSGKPNPYTLRITHPQIAYIDASDPATSNWTRFINTANKQHDVNVKFTTNGCVEALHHIKHGTKFLVSYGDNYWNNDGDTSAAAATEHTTVAEVIIISSSSSDDEDEVEEIDI